MKAPEPMTNEAKRDLVFSAVADSLEAMQQDVASLNTRIGVCRKLMLLALGGDSNDSPAPTDPEHMDSYEDFDPPAPLPPGGRNGRKDKQRR